MAGALEILPRAVDHHGDAAEILKAAELIAVSGESARSRNHTLGQAKEQIRGPLRLDLIDLLLPHRTDHRERLDGALDRLGREHGDRIERLRAAAAGTEARAARNERRTE